MPLAGSRWWIAAGVFAATFAFHSWYALHGLAHYDVGFLLDGVERVRRGAVFARDFQAPYGPLRYYLIAGWFEITGPSLAAFLRLSALLLSLTSAGLFLLARRRVSLTGALTMTAMAAVAHGPFHKCFLALALVLSLASFEVLLRRPAPRRAVAAGALGGLAFLLRYDVGVFAGCCMAVGLVLPPAGGVRVAARLLPACILGFVLGAATLVVPLALQGASLSAWWDHTKHRTLALGGLEPEPFPWPVTAGGLAELHVCLLFVGLVVGLALPLLLGIGVLVRSRQKRPLDGDGWRLAVAAFALLSLNQVQLMWSLNRLFQVLSPVLLAGADLLTRRGRRGAGHATLVALALLLLAWVHSFTVGPYPGTYPTRVPGTVRLDLPRGGVCLEPAVAQELQDIVAHIQRLVPEDEPVAATAGCEFLAFLADRRLVGPFIDPIIYHGSTVHQQAVIAALEAEQPRLFLYHQEYPLPVVLERAAPLVSEYLQSHYRPAAQYGRLYLTTRRRRPR